MKPDVMLTRCTFPLDRRTRRLEDARARQILFVLIIDERPLASGLK